MLLAAAVAVAAVGLGLLLGLAPGARARLSGPLRTFALAAALGVVVSHLLPEAFAKLGAPGLYVFAATVAVPGWTRLVSRLTGSTPRGGHSHAGLGAGYLGLLVHHVGDGLGLGAYGSLAGGAAAHADVLLALAVHTVPLVAVVTFAFRGRLGTKAAVTASAGLAIASLLGVGASGLVPAAALETISGYIAAGVAALLVHVVTHDLDRDLPEDNGARAIDALAALFGVATALAGGEPELGMLRAELGQALLGDALPLAVALVAAVLLSGVLARSSSDIAQRWLGPMPPPAFGLDGVLAAFMLGGTRFGALFAVGLLLITRAVALRGGGPDGFEDAELPFVPAALARLARLAPGVGAGLLVAALLRLLPDGALGDLPRATALVAALAVALPSGMNPTAAVLVTMALAERGLSPGVALAFGLVAAAPTLEALDAARGSRGRAAWTLAATLLVGIGVGWGSRGALALKPTLPDAVTYTALAVLVPALALVTFQRGVRGLLLAVVPSHDSVEEPHHHHEHDVA